MSAEFHEIEAAILILDHRRRWPQDWFVQWIQRTVLLRRERPRWTPVFPRTFPTMKWWNWERLFEHVSGFRKSDGLKFTQSTSLWECPFKSFHHAGVGLKHLGTMTDLRTLDILGFNGDGGLEPLVGMEDLEVLVVMPNTWLLRAEEVVTDAEFKHLKELSKLRRLGFLGISGITGTGLKHLAGLPHLTELGLVGMDITDTGLEHMKGLSHVEQLELSETKITDEGLEHLTSLTRLQKLGLGGTKITDAGLEHLAGLVNLSNLNLYGTNTTEDAVAKLQQSLPECEVIGPERF